ncbi:MAG: hypothetical protein H7210_13375 [Pyrinomonadaceae bacterium]|nr:hypothetical protein [Phycisphaerales bacterium]
MIGRRWGGFRKMVPALQLPITDPGIVLTTVILLAAAVVAGALPMVSYLNVFIAQLKGGLAGAAIGLATYYLIARKFNPIAWAMFGVTFVAAFLLGMVGESGRRGILGVLMAIGWMWWYFGLRHQTLFSKVVKFGAIGIFTFVVVMMYASFRGQGGTGPSGRGGYTITKRATQIAEFAKNPTIQRGAIFNMLGSDAPTDTMFIMENYPGSYEYDPFNGLKFFIANPIPRAIWPSKPSGMGVKVQKQLATGGNLGIGILGHGWSEGGWLGIAGYAIFFGALMGAVDRLIRDRAWNPYFLAAIGSNLGNVFGIARGETSLFMVLVFSGFVGAVAVMYAAKMICGPIMASGRPLLTTTNQWIAEPVQEDFVEDPEYGVEYDEGVEYAESEYEGATGHSRLV